MVRQALVQSCFDFFAKRLKVFPAFLAAIIATFRAVGFLATCRIALAATAKARNTICHTILPSRYASDARSVSIGFALAFSSKADR